MIKHLILILTPVPDLAWVGGRVALREYPGVVVRLEDTYRHKPETDSVEHSGPWFKWDHGKAHAEDIVEGHCASG